VGGKRRELPTRIDLYLPIIENKHKKDWGKERVNGFIFRFYGWMAAIYRHVMTRKIFLTKNPRREKIADLGGSASQAHESTHVKLRLTLLRRLKGRKDKPR